MTRNLRDSLRDRSWDVYARVGCWLGLYTKCASADGRYYYVRGPGLGLAHFCVISEHLATEDSQNLWVKDWLTGKPAAVLYFSVRKLKLRNYSKATFAEADWYRGFVEVDRWRRTKGRCKV